MGRRGGTAAGWQPVPSEGAGFYTVVARNPRHYAALSAVVPGAGSVVARGWPGIPLFACWLVSIPFAFFTPAGLLLGGTAWGLSIVDAYRTARAWHLMWRVG